MIVGLVVVTLVLAIAMTLLGELYTPPADGPCDKYLGKQTAQGISVYAACEEARRMRGEK